MGFLDLGRIFKRNEEVDVLLNEDLIRREV